MISTRASAHRTAAAILRARRRFDGPAASTGGFPHWLHTRCSAGFSAPHFGQDHFVFCSLISPFLRFLPTPSLFFDGAGAFFRLSPWPADPEDVPFFK